MAKCINCNEIELKNPKAKFCSDRCRMQYKRTNNPNTEKPEHHNPNTLHPAIIAGINRLTTNPDGTVDEQARTNRLAAARAYQRMYPDKQYTGVGIAPEDLPASPVPVRVSKPGDADYRPLCQTTRDWWEANHV